MRYNKELVAIADEYRKRVLMSDDVLDNTVMNEDWTMDKVSKCDYF